MRARGFGLLALVTLTFGCTKDEDTSDTSDTSGDADTDADADSDADSDADADADADSDTDADADVTGLSGTATFTRTVGEATVCDLDLTLTSTGAYTGDCPDCSFAFHVDTTVASDTSTSSCEKDHEYFLYTFQEGTEPDGTVITDPWIAFSEAYTYTGYFGEYLYEDVLVVGNRYDTGDYAGDHFHYDYSTYTYIYGTDVDGPYPNDEGSASVAGTAFTWSFAWDDTEYTYAIGELCDAETGAEGTAGVTTGVSVVDDLPCDNDTVDIYEITVAGDAALSVSVDTTDSAKFGDPFVVIVDAAGCTVWDEDDSFACTAQPTTGGPYDWCPAWGGTVPTSGGGTWRIGVMHASSTCLDTSQTTWEYRLNVDGSTTTTLTPVEDDVVYASSFDIVTTSTGSLTLQR